MSKDQALRLALEALESHIVWFSRDTMIGKAMRKKAEDSITAIKQALANDALDRMADNEHELGIQMQPEPEPVAWRNAALRVGEDLCSVGPFGYYDMTAEQWLDWALSVITVHALTPKREPLTDEEIDALPFPPSGTATLRDFVRIIEAAHGIKGEA